MRVRYEQHCDSTRFDGVAHIYTHEKAKAGLLSPSVIRAADHSNSHFVDLQSNITHFT